jgi:putative membrane protein
MFLLLQFFATAGALSFFIQSWYISWITLENGYTSLLIFVIILALVNLVLGTVLRIITFPIRLITFGAFSFVISCIVVKVADEFVPGVTITNIPSVVIVALIVALISMLFRMVK